MNLIRLIPVFISFFLLGAHFSRAGMPIIAVCCLAAPALLYFTTPLAARTIQVLLLLGAAQWIRTLIMLIGLRHEYDLPYIKLTVILATVALYTALSAWVFSLPALKKKYFHT